MPAAIDTPVVWDSAAGGDGMVADVQSWIDNPGGNNGWRIESSTEGGTASQAQKFYAREASNAPSLAVDYACKTGFSEAGNLCTPCTNAARVACAAGMQGNVCNDPGAPATSYLCVCGHPAYTGTGTQSCVDKNDCVGNPCDDAGDAAATCADRVAPAIGYDCACSAGFAQALVGAVQTCAPAGTGGSGGGGGTSGGGAGGGSGGGGGGGGASGAAGGATGAGGASGTGGTTGASGASGAGGASGASGASGTGGATGAGGASGASGASGTGGASGAGGDAFGGAGGGAGGASGAGARGGAAGTGAGGRGGAGGSAGTMGGSGNSGCSCEISAQARTTPAADLLLGVIMLTGFCRRGRRRNSLSWNGMPAGPSVKRWC